MRIRLLWLGACIALALPILISMPPNFGTISDGALHLHRTVSASISLQEGIYPRWTPYLHHGFGYPMHNFYSPMVYIMAALLLLLTPLSALASLNLLTLSALVLYPIGAYLWARTMAGRAASLVAGAFYLYAPLRLREVWVQANIPQLWAMALMPFVLWALYHAVQTGRGRWIALTGALFGFLIMTHHLTAFLFAPFLGLYGLYLLWHRGRSAFLPLTLALSLGVAIATIYWLPTLGELRQTQIDTIQDEAYSIQANFVTLQTLTAPSAPIDLNLYNWTSIDGTFGARMGQAQIAVALLMLFSVWWWWRRTQAHERVLIVGALSIMALCTLLMLEVSAPLWDMIPLIGYVQFPWRLLGIVYLVTVPLAAYLVQMMNENLRPYFAGALIALSFAFILPMLYAPFMPSDLPDNPTPADAIEYERLSGNLGLSASNEYLPVAVQTRPIYGLFVRDVTTPETRIERYNMDGWWFDIDENTQFPDDTRITPERVRAGMAWQIATPQAFTLIVHQMDFIGWRATLNGEPITITPTQPYGLISVSVPTGEHRLEVVYAGSTLQHVATLITLLGMSALLGVAPLKLPHVHAQQSPRIQQTATNLPLTIIGASLAFALIHALWLQPHTDVFRLRSALDAPPAPYPADIRFGDALALIGYDAPTTARAGDTITVTLYWRSLQPLDIAYGSALVLTDAFGEAYANQNNYRIAGLDTRTWHDEQYVIERYRLPIDVSAPPFVLNLRASIFGVDADGALSHVSAQDDSGVFAQLRLLGDWRQHADHVLNNADLALGDAVTIMAWAWSDVPQSQDVCLLVRWRAERDDLPEYAVMLHWYDEAGELSSVHDTAPLGNRYPTTLWQAGQVLDDVYCLPRHEDAHQLHLSMYRREDTVRLPDVLTITAPWLVDTDDENKLIRS